MRLLLTVLSSFLAFAASAAPVAVHVSAPTYAGERTSKATPPSTPTWKAP
jgi:hypothetical protein